MKSQLTASTRIPSAPELYRGGTDEGGRPGNVSRVGTQEQPIASFVDLDQYVFAGGSPASGKATLTPFLANNNVLARPMAEVSPVARAALSSSSPKQDRSLCRSQVMVFLCARLEPNRGIRRAVRGRRGASR